MGILSDKAQAKIKNAKFPKARHAWEKTKEFGGRADPVDVLLAAGGTLGSVATGNPMPLIATTGMSLARHGQKEANQTNILEAEKQRQWQSDEYSTRYQRQVSDMIDAGLNPMLSHSLGAGSVGSGAKATVENEEAQAAATAVGLMQAMASVEATKAQASLTETKQALLEPKAKVARAASSAMDKISKFGSKMFSGHSGQKRQVSSTRSPVVHPIDQKKIMDQINYERREW